MVRESRDTATNGKQQGQCSQGDSCSLEHDTSKRGKAKTSVTPLALILLHCNLQEETVKNAPNGRTPRRQSSRKVPEVLPEVS